ncbi:DNA phosphorothioation system sulfurtransferase DndC [Chamaesiphon sp. GL140_3_metabinner_50]|uniref:DNA phosphorothioation system sulfurtransferase DndC n=1 Tax=Chamaesiphon sp. GL140_3_metabinner_50 TaxID=2970812 RepID=UPI0025F4EC50|nr:DNA phosphorothioation system sulfurtransferase DndC [Chamaesiphon sp. GL140_3_metabinner_50]
MNDLQTSLPSARSLEQLVEHIQELTREIQDLYLSDTVPWIVGISWGKDSSTILQLIWTAIEDLPVEQRHKKVYVMTTDTLVENPIVAVWVTHSMKVLKAAAQAKSMPFEPHLLHPAVKDSFWACLMGKGYPAPRHGFRWCTERMKIKPVNQFIRDILRVYGETIIVLGVRKSESNIRAAVLKKNEVGRVRDRLSPNPNLANSLIYSPIEDWRTDEVWMYLMQFKNPWGGNNQDLFTLYRGATADNECPLVVDTSTPSCGDSRFGCWVCTLVSKDKSMEAMIQNDEDKEWLQPLLDIRNELDIHDDRDKRDFRRIYGRVELFERKSKEDKEVTEIVPIPGPYTKFWREHWLRRVLEAQVQIRQTAPPDMQDIILITEEELGEIRRIWLEEKHEFDDSLPRIYEEVMGKPFKDTRIQEKKLLGGDEWSILEEICSDDAMHLELMAKLLDTERQHATKSRRGVFENLEKCFDSSSRSKEEAIAIAHEKRDLKEAASQGNVEKVKQLTWAQMKYKNDEGTDLSES